MTTATNVDATAVNTVAWLSAAERTIVVPVYQRQYRWDIGGCEQLLADIRAVADSDDRHMHFIGSILSSESTHDGEAELVLIDGQQRMTTLMLLIAALHHTVRSTDSILAGQLQKVLVHGGEPVRTKLRPHRAWAGIFESVVLDRRSQDGMNGDSRFDDNYAFFRSQISPDEAAHIWMGLQKLEHVSITLGAGANAQQIFESLNSTGEPLRDHELIHNYVLMGLSHTEQSEIEDAYWVPIEQNTGEAIAGFWRHYLIMRTGREVAVGGGRGVYDAFRQEFPRLEPDSLRDHLDEWRMYSEIYRILLDPAEETDVDVSLQLGYVNTFGRDLYPLVMRVYDDHRRGALAASELISALEQIQSLLLRRTVVGITSERLVARLCRAAAEGLDALTLAISRIMPSDQRVRVALKYGALPHPGYVLGRLAGVHSLAGLDVEHVVPPTPGDTWTGDGERAWAEYSEDEQNSHRALAPTLGNLTLIEESLGMSAFDASFPAKRDDIYPESRLAMTRDIAATKAWSTAAIAERTVRLTAEFVRIWSVPVVVRIDDDGLVPIHDAQRRRGWPAGWQREFAYVQYRGEHWEVPDVKYLFNRIFKRLWADSRDSVISFSERRGGPVYSAQAWTGQWDTLDESSHLYMGWDSKYMLTAVQGVLEEADIAHEVFVKYSYIGEIM